MANDDLVLIVAVQATEVDLLQVHHRHVVAPLRLVVRRDDFLSILPPVGSGIVVRGLDLQDRRTSFWK